MLREIQAVIKRITPLNQAAMTAAQMRQSRLAKPLESMGLLEDISVQLAGITGFVTNKIEKSRIVVLCADNGIIEEGVSSTPRSLTASQSVKIMEGESGMGTIAKFFGDEVMVVDVGIADPYDCPAILKYKIGHGTNNFAKEDAMEYDDAERAMLIGIDLADRAKRDGCDVLGVGELGVGNTTTSAAVLSVLTFSDIEEVTGRGTGLTNNAFEHKKEVIRKAIADRAPDPDDVIDVISKVGGFEIAAMCGVYLGAAANRIPVVIDGFISAVAAVCAARLCPDAAAYMFPSHESFEPGYILAMDELNLTPWLDLRMKLGEGCGCTLAFQIMKAACAAMNNMAIVGEDPEIDESYLDEAKKKDIFTFNR